ncbi:MAG: hypothetical protein ACTHKC_08990 [Candidatus Nitrosocosmicus sp.]
MTYTFFEIVLIFTPTGDSPIFIDLMIESLVPLIIDKESDK